MHKLKTTYAASNISLTTYANNTSKPTKQGKTTSPLPYSTWSD